MRYRNGIRPAVIIGSACIATAICLMAWMPYQWEDAFMGGVPFTIILVVSVILLVSAGGLLKGAMWGRNLLSILLHLLAATFVLLFGGLLFSFDAPLAGRTGMVFVGLFVLPAILIVALLVYLHSDAFMNGLTEPPPATHQKPEKAKRKLGWRSLVAVLLALYLLTWMFGAPAVQTAETRITVLRYKMIASVSPTLAKDPNFPAFATHAAFPVLPGVILLRQDGAAANLDGYGAWVVYVWYGFGSKRLLSYRLWAS